MADDTAKPSAMSALTRGMVEALEPLDDAEADQAVSAAVEYLKPELVRDDVSHFRVLGAESAVFRHKDRDGPFIRAVEVMVADYLNRRHLRVVVEQGNVVEVRELDYQPALSADEIDEAGALAATVPEIEELSSRTDVFTSAFTPGASEPGQRSVGLYYLSTQNGDAASIVAVVELDLVEQRVLDVRLPQ